jgi:hypothetical protein
MLQDKALDRIMAIEELKFKNEISHVAELLSNGVMGRNIRPYVLNVSRN